MRSSLLALAAAIVLATAAPGLAKTIVVKTNGAVSTIQDAVDMAGDGDKIIINRGVYFESVTATQNNLKFVGRRAIWDGTNATTDRTCLTLSGNGCSVQGITFRNGHDQLVIEGDDAVVRTSRFRGADGNGIKITGEDALIDRCRFDGTDSYCVRFDETSGGAVRRCNMRNCGDSAVYVDVTNGVTVDRCSVAYMDSYGMEIDDSVDATITRCRVRNVDGDGYVFDSSTDATITSCSSYNTYDSGLASRSSDGMTITNCRFTGARRSGLVETAGSALVIRGCRLNGSYYHGIEHEGSATIENNVIVDFAGNGVDLSEGDGSAIRNNTIRESGGGGGLRAVGDDITIDGNLIQGVVDYGLQYRGDAGTIRNNRVSDCCDGRGEAGFEIEGSDNDVINNRVTNGYGDGFYISGDRNTLTGCRVLSAVADGFDIASGADNSLTGCFATGCDGEALDNSGTDTDVTNCTFRSSRILLGNDGTFDTFTGNNVDLDDAVAPEVD